MPLTFPTIDSAIAGFEQSNPLYNNPMAVQAGAFATSFGCSGTAGNGLAICPDKGTGFDMGDSLLSRYSSQGLTLGDAINKWATGSTTGDAGSYPGYVGQKTGLPLTSHLPDLFSSIPGAGAVLGPAKSLLPASSIFNPSLSRIVSIILGLIMIAGGIYLFKPVQQVVDSGIKNGSRLIAA